LIAIILIIFTTFFNTSIKERMINKTINSMGLAKDSKQTYIFTPQRDQLIKGAYNMFLDKPLFGHGPKMFRVLCEDERYSINKKSCSTHPHNFYIQLLAETGIVGFLFLLSAFIYLIYYAARQLKAILFKEKRYLSDYQVCLLACLLITLWPFAPNGNFFNNWLAICYSLPVGFYLHSIYGKNNKEVIKEQI